LLNCCDRRSALGRRDYAMIITLLRLGLRASEVSGSVRSPTPTFVTGGRETQERRASVGAVRAARIAGYYPAAAPTTSAAARPPHTASSGTTIAQPCSAA